MRIRVSPVALALCVSLTLCGSVFAQSARQLLNRQTAPRAGEYWQQQVDYEIDVTLSRDGRTISGSQVFIYTNNSPDTLTALYLKAFPNSARRGSLMDRRNCELEDYSIAEADESQFGSLKIWNVRGRQSDTLLTRLDDTIYEVTLKSPLAPGETRRFSLEFETVLPVGIGDRHGYIGGQSKAAYWYPQVCVYDRRVGWVDAPYLGRGECYGDFGDFTVSITAPENRVVVATGLLSNRSEVMPDSLRAALDIENFYGPRETWPTFTFDPSKTKTWKFYAKRVNDFTWVAASNFCMDDEVYNGVQLEVYARRSTANGWRNALEYARRSLVTFSELYGDYRWPAIKVTDSYDGMEYPMITFCNGGAVESPTFSLLVYHEIAHFWFMGLIGSSQVDRACLDEGFTTMAEIFAMEKYHGRKGNNVRWDHHWYKRNFYPLDEDRDARGYRIYLEWARSGYDLPMIIPSDNANEYWAYRNSSYYKPVVMHFTLRSIYGDSLYFAAMKRYGDKWMFKHPYEDDFVETFSGVVGENLKEYFEQWFRSRRRIDYAYGGHKRIDGDRYEVKLKKPGDFVTPVDVALVTQGGDTVFYTVNPEGHSYVKPGFTDGGVWRQYRQPSYEYTFEVAAPGGIAKGIVDPHNLLPDINRLNNQSGLLPPIEWHVDPLFYNVPSMHKYSMRWRPDLWYDDPGGVTVGWHLGGSYIKKDKQLSLDIGYATRSERLYLDGEIALPFAPLGALAYTGFRALVTDYRDFERYFITKEYRKRWTGSNYTRFELSMNSLGVTGDPHDLADPLSHAATPFVGDGNWDAFTHSWAQAKQRSYTRGRIVAYESTNELLVSFRPNEDSGPAFGQVVSSHDVSVRLPESLILRGSATFAASSRDVIPDQFLFHPSRARPVDVFTDSRLLRSPGTVPREWRSDVYLNNNGLRGYQDRALYGGHVQVYSLLLQNLDAVRWLQLDKAPFVGGYLGRFSTEVFLQTGRTYFDAQSALGVYETSAEHLYYSAAGVSFVSPDFWEGQRVRLDFPLYLSRPLPGEDKWDFRFSAALMLPLPTERWSTAL